MAGLVDALRDAVPLGAGLVIAVHIVRRDHLGGVTGARRRDGEVVRLAEIVLEPDDWLRGQGGGVERLGHGATLPRFSGPGSAPDTRRSSPRPCPRGASRR